MAVANETNSEDDALADSSYEKRVIFAIGGVVALVSPIQHFVGVPYAFGDFLDALASIFGSLVGFVFEIIAVAIIEPVAQIFLYGTYEFLFFAPPSRISGLSDLWGNMAVLFIALLPVVGAVFFLSAMLFPESEKADMFRFFERAFAASIAVLVFSPYFVFYVPTEGWVDLFSAIVVLVNDVGQFIAPSDYSLEVLTASTNSFMGAIGGLAGIGAAIIAATVLGVKLIIGMMLVVAIFYIMLAMRMILVYTIYGMLPLFMVLWIVDIGPLKYGKMVSSMIIKLTAVLLLMGIVMSGVLAASDAVAGQSVGSDLEFLDDDEDMTVADPMVDGGEVSDDYDTDVDLKDGGDADSSSADQTNRPGGELSSDDDPGFQRVVIGIFAFLAGPVLCIALTTSSLGMALSMKGTSGMKSRARQGRSADPQSGMSSYGGSGQAGGGGGDSPSGFAEGEWDHIKGGNEVDLDGGEGMGSVDAAQPENPTEVPIKDKIAHTADWATGGRASDMADSYGEAKDKVTDMDAWDDAADTVEDTVGDALGDKAGAVAGGGIKATGYAAKVGAKVGNLGKRGGKAWYSVFKQPDAGSSLAEAGRIARESPIGKPKSPNGEVTDDGKTGMDDTETADGDASVDGAEMEAADTPDWWGGAADGEVEWGDGGGGEKKRVVDDGEAEDIDPGELADIPLSAINNNPEQFENKRFNPEGEFTVEGVESKPTQQKARLNHESGEEVYHIGFDSDGEGPTLEEGESVSFENARLREYNEDEPWSHDGVPEGGDYWQLQTDEHTRLER